MFDADDRQALAQVLVIAALFVVGVVLLAFALGLAWNVFEFMRGF